jgi:beta-glucanase (GH16 family)
MSPAEMSTPILAPAAAVAPAGGSTPAIPETDGYKLVWHDEFNKDGPLNAADWAYEQGFVRNQELQWYQPENAVCKEGFLVIEARKESKPNPRYVGPAALPAATAATGTAPATATAPGRGRGRAGRGAAAGSGGWQNRPMIEVTSASVNTRGRHEWTYGRFEIRAKIDTRAGSWPAFWTLGTMGGWPGNGEIDIMEYYRNMLLFNVAWEGPGGAVWNSVTTQMSTLPPDWAQQFHAWRMDWDEKAIKLFLDDKLINEQDLTKTVNTAGRGNGVNPFINRPVYLLLNQAIGGQNGGDPGNTEFPVKFHVDYVRVWQKPAATK